MSEALLILSSFLIGIGLVKVVVALILWLRQRKEEN